MRDAYLCEGARTPVGRYGGSLASVRPDDLLAHADQGGRSPRRRGSTPHAIDEVYRRLRQPGGRGQSQRRAHGGAARRACRTTVPGATINRLCGSGPRCGRHGRARRSRRRGELVHRRRRRDACRARPSCRARRREAFSRHAEIYDTTIGWRFVNPLMKAQYGVDSMPETGENVAEEFQIARADQDAFALPQPEPRRRRAEERPPRARDRARGDQGPQGQVRSSSATSIRARRASRSSPRCRRPSARAAR